MAKQALKGVQVCDLENNELLREEIRREFEKASLIFDEIKIKPSAKTITEVSPILSETEIEQQIEDAISVSEQISSNTVDWADNLFDFCEVAA